MADEPIQSDAYWQAVLRNERLRILALIAAVISLLLVVGIWAVASRAVGQVDVMLKFLVVTNSPQADCARPFGRTAIG